MSDQLYFYTKDLPQAEAVIESLLEAGIDEDRIGVISRVENIELTELPKATIAEKSDLINALQRGAGTGGVLGLLAGLVTIIAPGGGLLIGGASLVAATTVGGTIFGAWSASLIGVSENHPIVDKFDKELDKKGFLILVSMPADPDAAVELSELVASQVNLSSDVYGVYDID